MLNSRKNAIIIEMKIPITQSESWHKLQKALGKTSFLTKESDFQYLAILSNTPVGNYLYCPYGPCYDTSEGFDLARFGVLRLSTTHFLSESNLRTQITRITHRRTPEHLTTLIQKKLGN